MLSDEESDLQLAARVRCGVGIIPAAIRPLVTAEKRSAPVIDWRRDAPLLQHVSLADVLFAEETVRAAGVEDSAFGALGYEILAQTARGPLMVSREEAGDLRLDLLVSTDRSTLPYRVGFPIFAANLVQLALERAGLAEAAADRTGTLPPLALQPASSYRITDPRGAKRDESSDSAGMLRGVPAPFVGDYEISGPEAAGLRMGAALLAPAETRLAAVETIAFGDQLTVQAAPSEPRTDRPLWWPLAALGFLILLGEWWWFQRPGRSASTPLPQ